MGNHTATRSRGRSGKAASGTSTGRAAPAAAPSRWQGGGGEPATTFLDHTPTADSARPTVYDSPTQRAAIHLQALGTVALHHEEASVFDAPGRRIYTAKGTRDEVKIPQEDRHLLAGQAMLHNHPSGNSFSPSDIIFLEANNLRAIHVVSATPQARLAAVRAQTTPTPTYLFTMRLAPMPAHLVPGTREYRNYSIQRSRRILSTFSRVEAETERQFVERIRARQVPAEQAQLAHYHQVWNQVAHALPDDLSYTWEILTP